jgi:hypothetical protein
LLSLLFFTCFILAASSLSSRQPNSLLLASPSAWLDVPIRQKKQKQKQTGSLPFYGYRQLGLDPEATIRLGCDFLTTPALRIDSDPSSPLPAYIKGAYAIPDIGHRSSWRHQSIATKVGLTIPKNAPQRPKLQILTTDVALVSLTVINPTPEFAYPTRHLLLRKSSSTVSLGRMSKKNGVFAARENNGWIDSAVMSRDHAKLVFDPQSQVSYYILLFRRR